MKIQKNSTKNKKILYLTALIALLALFILGFYAYTTLSGTNTAKYNSDATRQSTEQTPAGDKTDPIDQPQPTTTNDKSPHVSTYQPPANNEGITLTASQEGQSIVITTKLVGYSDGQCELTLAANGKTTTKTAPVIFQAQASTCAGFSIPISELGKGSWSTKLQIMSGEKTTEKTISYEVT